jgi:hypothetical protein
MEYEILVGVYVCAKQARICIGESTLCRPLDEVSYQLLFKNPAVGIHHASSSIFTEGANGGDI